MRRIVTPVQIPGLNRTHTVHQHITTYKRICLARPRHRATLGIINIHPLKPAARVPSKTPILDRSRQTRRERPRNTLRAAAGQLLRNLRVPDMAAHAVWSVVSLSSSGREYDVLQVCAAPIIRDSDGISADVKRLVMQRLVDVTDKVDHKAHRIEPLRGARARVLQLPGEVRDGAYYAPTLAAVAVELDAAACGWRVIGIDEVKRLGPRPCAGVAVTVGPSGGVSHVGRRGVAQGILDKCRSLGRGKVLRYVGDGFVAHGAPGVGNTDGQRKRCCDEGDWHLHDWK